MISAANTWQSGVKFKRTFWIQLLDAARWGDFANVQGKCSFDDSGQTTRGLTVTKVRL